MEQPKLLLVMGPQASGKTTYVNEFFLDHKTWDFVSSDLYWPRDDTTGKRYWIDADGQEHDWGTKVIPPEILQMAYRWAYQKFLESIIAKRDVVVEATFISRADRKRMIQDAKEEDYLIHGIYFYPSLLTCAARNVGRQDRVPDAVLARTYARIELPTAEEGFHKIQIIDTQKGNNECLTG